MFNYLHCTGKTKVSKFLAQKKPVAIDESKIPWNINVGEQVICLATNVDIPRFFFLAIKRKIRNSFFRL